MSTLNWSPTRSYATTLNTAVQIASQNLGRTFLAIFNEGAGATRVYLGANDLVGFPLAAGGNAEFAPVAPGNAIFVKGAATTVTIVEGVGGPT